MVISHSFLYVYQRVSHGHPMVTLPKTWDVDGSSMVTPLWRWHDRNDMTDCFCLCLYIYIYIYPIGSMYAIYGNIYHQYTPNVSIYTIHGSYEYIIIYCCMCMYTYIYTHTLYIHPWFLCPQNSQKPLAHWPRHEHAWIICFTQSRFRESMASFQTTGSYTISGGFNIAIAN